MDALVKKNLTVCVLGKSGQLAQSLAEKSKNYPDISLTCFRRDEVNICDIQQIAHMVESHKPDILINAAAYTSVDLAEDETKQAYQLNKTAVDHLAQVANIRDIPLVHISTDYVFSGNGTTPYKVSDPVAPLGVYGQSKYDGEEALRTQHSKHLILRTAWVYSPFGANFVKTILRIMGFNKQIKVVDDQWGCPTSALDLADAILKVVPKLCSTGFKDFGTYHLVGKGEINWHGFATEIHRQMGTEWDGQDCNVLTTTTAEYKTKAKRPAYSVLSCTKFKDVFGFSLPDWRDSLKTCLHTLKDET